MQFFQAPENVKNSCNPPRFGANRRISIVYIDPMNVVARNAQKTITYFIVVYDYFVATQNKSGSVLCKYSINPFAGFH